MTITANELLLGEGEIEVDTFSLLMSLERALETNDGSVLAEKLQELELALEQVLKQRAFIGNTMRDLQEAQQKQEVQIFDQERRLSEIRDADLAESALHLKTAELNNRVSLDAGSRLIQPSLTDFCDKPTLFAELDSKRPASIGSHTNAIKCFERPTPNNGKARCLY